MARWLAAGGLVLAAVFAIPIAVAGSKHAEKPRVIILGFDGVDARLTEKWLAEGRLPNLAKLKAMGSFAPLLSTIPSQTPVAWSTFATGLSPGKTGVFDFLKREPRGPKAYMPKIAFPEEGRKPFLLGERTAPVAGIAVAGTILAIVFVALKLFRARSVVAFGLAAVLGVAAGGGGFWFVKTYLPVEIPVALNSRQGVTMWAAAAAAGLKARVVHMPVTFPPEEFAAGHLLSGLGVVDIRGTFGTPAYFTSDPLDPILTGDVKNEFSVDIVELDDNKGMIETEIKGPTNKLFKEPARIDIPLIVQVAPDGASLTFEASGARQTVKPGQWSEWMVLEFPFNKVVKLAGIARIRVLSASPEVLFYMTPINFHPARMPPGTAITTPASWAKDLFERFSFFKTQGWAIDTWGVQDKIVGEEVFVEDMDMTVAKYREMGRALLAESDDDLFIDYYEFTDRVGHIMWRLFDPTHPAYDAEKAARWGGELLRSYQTMDAIVGEAMQEIDERTTLIVCSDHGFSTWHQSVNYNTWLLNEGYIRLEGQATAAMNLDDLFSQNAASFWPNVDWEHTRAYALGLGGLYINLAGREEHGSVAPGEEYENLRRELVAKLEGMVDPKTGKHPVMKVYTREEAYGSFDPTLIPDLIVTNSEGYRVSWQTSLGGMPKELFEVNEKVWSGDHCSLNPHVVPGIFFSNRKIKRTNPEIADIYPSVMKILSITPPQPVDGTSLF